MPYDDYSGLQVEVEAGVAWVTIDHPPLNVLDATLMTELDGLVSAVREDERVRVIVFQSADPEFFIAHGDMNFVDDPQAFAGLSIGDDASPLNPMMKLHERLRQLPQVTIAKIAGFARGGGSELAMALDMRFAAAGKAALSQNEAPMGIIPGAGGTVYLPRLAGRARSLEMILGAELFDAAQAERYGLVNRALPPEEIDSFVDSLARRIAALPPGVAAATKSAVDATVGPLTQGLAEGNELLGEVFTETAAELTRAALAAGAQTREGERDLEGLMSSI